MKPEFMEEIMASQDRCPSLHSSSMILLDALQYRYDGNCDVNVNDCRICDSC